MADLKIYNNGENKILMSAGDRIIRQPYDFGNAFQNRAGLSNYILIENLDVDLTNFGWFKWYDSPGGNQNIFSFQSPVDSYSFYQYGNGGQFGFTRNGGLGSNINLISTTPLRLDTGAKLLMYSSSDATYNYAQNFIKRTGSQNVSMILENATKLLLGAYSYENNAPTANTNTINRFILFDRNIGANEYDYFFNNGLGRDPQVRSGIYLYIICDKAEILNTGGTDFVGVRDYSGNNRHGKIMNLPGGELIEQLDWANANLFVPFIS